MWADNETKDDLLGYQVHADLLRDVVLDPKMLPISIGVFGDWGSGKSSLMLLMQESIEKWRTETEEANKVEGAAKRMPECFKSCSTAGSLRIMKILNSR